MRTVATHVVATVVRGDDGFPDIQNSYHTSEETANEAFDRSIELVRNGDGFGAQLLTVSKEYRAEHDAVFTPGEEV